MQPEVRPEFSAEGLSAFWGSEAMLLKPRSEGEAVLRRRLGDAGFFRALQGSRHRSFSRPTRGDGLQGGAGREGAV